MVEIQGGSVERKIVWQKCWLKNDFDVLLKTSVCILEGSFSRCQALLLCIVRFRSSVVHEGNNGQLESLRAVFLCALLYVPVIAISRISARLTFLYYCYYSLSG